MAAIMTSANAGKRWLTHVPPNLERVETSLERILSDASRASAIIDRMRSIATGEVTKKSEFDFNQAVLEIINTSKPQMQKNNIVLVTDLQLDLPKAVADRIQIQQVVGNLILNAIDAVNKVPAHRRNIRVSSEKRDGRILLSVQDSGVGIKAEDFPHLFEPFWTDKPEGLGIGLSICRSIVENNGGQIWAEHPGRKGAVFRFTVPACE